MENKTETSNFETKMWRWELTTRREQRASSITSLNLTFFLYSRLKLLLPHHILFTLILRKLRQFILTFWILLLLPSKHLAFLSFHIVHHVHAGIIFHQFSSAPLLPTPFQFRISKVFLGTTQLTPSIHKNKFHKFTIVLQCNNK